MNAATDRHAEAVAAAVRSSETTGAISAVFGPRRGRVEEVRRA